MCVGEEKRKDENWRKSCACVRFSFSTLSIDTCSGGKTTSWWGKKKTNTRKKSFSLSKIHGRDRKAENLCVLASQRAIKSCCFSPLTLFPLCGEAELDSMDYKPIYWKQSSHFIARMQWKMKKTAKSKIKIDNKPSAKQFFSFSPR